MAAYGKYAFKKIRLSNFRWAVLLVITGSLVYLSGCGSAPAPRTGKRDAYVVLGKRYRVLGSSKGYVQSGLASWYGPNFHGKLTANGETYDMEALTAAHRTLPLGTYVKVTRHDGGQEVVVRINDRGPFVKGRIIDMSRAGARHLGMLDEGVAQVTVRALGSRKGRSKGDEVVLKPEHDYGKGVFSVQVGAFTVKDNAHRLAREMRQRYGEADVSLYDRGDVEFFRVRVGRFSEEYKAEEFMDRLLEKGEFETAFVVAR